MGDEPPRLMCGRSLGEPLAADARQPQEICDVCAIDALGRRVRFGNAEGERAHTFVRIRSDETPCWTAGYPLRGQGRALWGAVMEPTRA
jgi:hypothetical protein